MPGGLIPEPSCDQDDGANHFTHLEYGLLRLQAAPSSFYQQSLMLAKDERVSGCGSWVISFARAVGSCHNLQR